MVLAAAFGTLPQDVSRWPWQRVYYCWTAWQRKERRELRVQMLLAHQSGLGTLAGLAGGSAGGEAPPSGDNDGSGALNAQGLARAASMGIPVKRVKTEG